MPKRKVPEEEKIKIGGRLREIREQKNLNQAEVARALGIKQKTISSYENDKTLPPLTALIKIVGFYKVGLEQLLYGRQADRKEITIKDEELLETFLLVDKLDSKDREVVKQVNKKILQANQK